MDYANMNYIVYFDYASLIVMSVLIISFYMIKHINNIQNRMLKIMLWSHFLVIGMDIINVIEAYPAFSLSDFVWLPSVLFSAAQRDSFCFFLLLLFNGRPVWRREAVASDHDLSSDDGYFCIGGIELLDGLYLSLGRKL